MRGEGGILRPMFVLAKNFLNVSALNAPYSSVSLGDWNQPWLVSKTPISALFHFVSLLNKTVLLLSD